jgi:large subunit ribosomal protein L9
MKVILNQDIKNIGKKDSLVEVSDGYARNYLLPRGLVSEASANNVNTMKSKNEAALNREAKELQKAKDLAKEVEKATVVIKTKTGENGKLFGSVTTKEIADRLKADYKLDIDKKKLVHDEPFKHVGEYEIEVKLYRGVNAKLKLKLESE